MHKVHEIDTLTTTNKGAPFPRGCIQHNPMNMLKTQVHPPCLELETWLMKNKRNVIQNFTIPKNSLKKKH
jgi:hypothetical protein